MIEQMRVRGRHLQTPICGYVHPDRRRRVWLVGMVHEGEPRYFDEIKTVVAGFMSAGAVVHAECTRTEDRSSATPLERELLDQRDRCDALSAAMTVAGGWVTQRTGWGDVLPDGWQRVDLTMLEIIRLAGPDVVGESLRADLETLDVEPATRAKAAKMLRLRQAGVYRTIARGYSLPAKRTDTILIDRRNQVALDGLDRTDRDTVLVWGASHLPGLDDGLLARGFIPDGQTWHTVGRLPSRLLHLPTILAGVVRNFSAVRRGIRDLYEANKQALQHSTEEQQAPPPVSTTSTTRAATGDHGPDVAGTGPHQGQRP